MKRKLLLGILSATLVVMFSSCKKSCLCTVNWREYHQVGTTGSRYYAEEIQEDYVVYRKDSYEDCESALEREFRISKTYSDSYGITRVNCKKH